MNVQDQLNALIEAAEQGPMVTVPVSWILELLEERMEKSAHDEPLADLTVQDVATAFGKSPQTVRDWCRRGLLPGSYRFRNREWRIPREALRTLRTNNLDDDDEGVRQRGTSADLGTWRGQVIDISTKG